MRVDLHTNENAEVQHDGSTRLQHLMTQVKTEVMSTGRFKAWPSGFYGVTDGYARANIATSWKLKKWQARLRYDGKLHDLGRFNTKQEAAAAYDIVARQQKGNDAVCSWPSAEEGAAAAALASSEWERENPAGLEKPRPKSGFYGVRANGKKWQVTLCYAGKLHCLGSFNTKQEAAVAHDKAARQHKGNDAACNFPSVGEGDAAAALASSEWERENPEAMKPRAKRELAPSIPLRCSGTSKPVQRKRQKLLNVAAGGGGLD